MKTEPEGSVFICACDTADVAASGRQGQNEQIVELRNAVVVVTGAGQGIGRAIATSLASAGAHLALVDLNAESLQVTAALCAEYEGVQARPFVANVADEAAVIDVFSQIRATYGRIDGLVNNAGIVRDALLLKLRDGKLQSRMSLQQWQAVIDVNLTGVFLCGREAATHMVETGGGVIVNISSISRAGNAGQTNYSAAKAGVAAMTVTWAKELGRYGIRTGTVAPGYTRTDILSAMRPEVLEKVVEPVPLKRLGEAGEIAGAVRFIFENDFFTGRCIDVDGGLRL
jgi:3-oxoacyl-[acyl-carrier protein] reductase